MARLGVGVCLNPGAIFHNGVPVGELNFA